MCSFYIFLLVLLQSLRFSKATQGWDYTLFTQYWPKSQCRVWAEKNRTETCEYSRLHDAWTIHGIWPTMSGTTGPEFCNQTWLYDPNEVQTLKSELDENWPNILKDSPEDSFWSHEWNKHGTCAVEVEIFNSQEKYFSLGLALFQKYTMTTVLSEAGIVPSYTNIYTLIEIYDAIRNRTNVNPEIKCTVSDGRQYLWEIRLCFSRSLELIDCKHRKSGLAYEHDGLIRPLSVLPPVLPVASST